MIIDMLHEEFESWQQALPHSAAAKFEELSRPGGAGRAARLAAETSVRAAEALVYESGEADLVVANLVTGDIEANEHMELTTRFGARGLLEDIARELFVQPA